MKVGGTPQNIGVAGQLHAWPTSKHANSGWETLHSDSPCLGSGKMCRAFCGCGAVGSAAAGPAAFGPAAAVAAVMPASCACLAACTLAKAAEGRSQRSTPATAVCARIRAMKTPPTVACNDLYSTHATTVHSSEAAARSILPTHDAAALSVGTASRAAIASATVCMATTLRLCRHCQSLLPHTQHVVATEGACLPAYYVCVCCSFH